MASSLVSPHSSTQDQSLSPSHRRESGAAFLVFEGLDGSGKSTLMKLLADELQARGKELIRTREPGGTPLAEEIRQLLLRNDAEAPVPPTELLLYAASRAQHVAGVIAPALQRGHWVLCDRFVASSVSFQCFARGLARANVDWLNQFAVQGHWPDLTILLDLTVADSRDRQEKRQGTIAENGDRMEKENLKFHENVRQGYLAQAKENPGSWLVLDATQSPEELRNKVIVELRGRGWLA